jgi:hypothetical protein
MKEWEKTYAKKEKVNSQLIGDRIFGLATLNMPQKTLDVDRNFISTNKSKEFDINGANADMDNYETI